MLKYTRHSLKKLEALLGELEYTVRYEKGNFNSGYCIVENKKIAVINKFFDVEGRMNCLLDILQNLEFDPDQLSDASQKLLKKIAQANSEEEEDEETEDISSEEE